jgi:hypothetical protein
MSISAMKQALEAFRKIHEGCGEVKKDNLSKESNKLATLVRKDCNFAMDELRQAIADAEKREWVGLTDEERDYIWEKNKTKLGGWDHGGDDVMYDGHFGDAVIAIEAKLKEKNG